MSQGSPMKGRQSGLTTLEMQAHNIVQDDDVEDHEINVNDQEKYDALVESRKNRRAVSILSFVAIADKFEI